MKSKSTQLKIPVETRVTVMASIYTLTYQSQCKKGFSAKSVRKVQSQQLRAELLTLLAKDPTKILK